MNTAQSKINKFSKGFTLIELLVVLGILGILATALVATIDPFEQLKKANDANVKNAAVELAEANLRYYTTHNAMPWHDPAAGGVTGCGTSGAIAPTADTQTVDQAGHGKECLTGLIDDGELKAEFGTATTITTKLYLMGTTGQSVKVCYKPESKSQQRDVNTAYSYDGSDGGASCKSKQPASGAVDCYWCAQL